MLIFLGSIMLALLILSIVLLAKDRWSGNNGWWFGVIFLTVALISTVLSATLTYASNATRVAELKAFQEANIQNFAITVEETRVILSDDKLMGALVAGSLEKLEVGKSISERIKEWRVAINEYNLEVANKKKVRTLWVYPGWMIMPAEVNDLKLLTIK